MQFNFRGFSLDCYLISQEVLFLGVDVARILGYSNSSRSIVANTKEHHRRTHSRSGKQGGRPALFLTLSGVVSMALKSQLDTATEFQEWVVDEVIPEVLHRGAYLSPDITPEQALEAREKIDRILEVANPWERMYQKEACDKAFKWFGTDFYWTYCYSWMTPAEVCKLNLVNPVVKGDREQRIHQYLEQETRDRLAPHATRLVDFLVSSTSKQDFQTRMGRIFGSDQQELDLG